MMPPAKILSNLYKLRAQNELEREDLDRLIGELEKDGARKPRKKDPKTEAIEARMRANAMKGIKFVKQ